MAHRAKIDHDGVYWGVEEVGKLLPGDLEVPHDCDCRPGAYKLMPAVGDALAYLEPIDPQNVKTVPNLVTSDRAFFALVKHLHAINPANVPALTVSWAAEYETTFDMDQAGWPVISGPCLTKGKPDEPEPFARMFALSQIRI